MQSFFSKLKSKFSSEYGGRYMGIILEALITEEPKLLLCICPSIDKKYLKGDIIQPIVEKPFEGEKKKKRFADIVIQTKNEDIPIAYIEIKYEDDLHEGQLEDYIKIAQKNNSQFTYLTKYTPSTEVLQLLNENGFSHLLYTQLYERIQKVKLDSSYFIAQFCKFLEESFMLYNKNTINKNALTLMLMNNFDFYNRGIGGQKRTPANMENTIITLEHLINNISILTNRLYENNSQYFSQRSKSSFRFFPVYNTAKLTKEISNNKSQENIEISSKALECGSLVVSSYLVIKGPKNKWLYLVWGIAYDYFLKKKPYESSFRLYTEVIGSGIDGCYEEKIYNEEIKVFENEEKIYITYIRLLNKTITEFLDNNPSMDKTYKTNLEGIQKNIL
jgi:hypothetical protein